MEVIIQSTNTESGGLTAYIKQVLWVSYSRCKTLQRHKSISYRVLCDAMRFHVQFDAESKMFDWIVVITRY